MSMEKASEFWNYKINYNFPHPWTVISKYLTEERQFMGLKSRYLMPKDNVIG